MQRPFLPRRCLRMLSSKSLGNLPRSWTAKYSNTPRPPKDPPDDCYNPKCVGHDGIQVSEFVPPKAYRQFTGSDEQLGPGAGGNKEYKNAHYFGYHRFSFVELQNLSVKLRDESRSGCGLKETPEEAQAEEIPDDNIDIIREQEAVCDKQLAAQAAEDCAAAKEAESDPCKAMEKQMVVILKDCEEKAKEDGESVDCSELVKTAIDKAVEKKEKDAKKCDKDKGDNEKP